MGVLRASIKSRSIPCLLYQIHVQLICAIRLPLQIGCLFTMQITLGQFFFCLFIRLEATVKI